MAFRGFVTYLDLYVALHKQEDIRDHLNLCRVLISNSNINLSESDEADLQKWCRKFCYRVYAKWRQSKSCPVKFNTKNSSWLNSDIEWPLFIKENIPISESSDNVVVSESPNVIMSPSDTCENEELVSPSNQDASTSTQKDERKTFEELGYRQKRRRISENVRVRTKSEATELAFSAVQALKSTGNDEVADVLKYMLNNPEAVSNIRKSIVGESSASLTEIPAVKDPILAQIRPRMDTKSKRTMLKEALDLLIEKESHVEFVDVEEIVDSDPEDSDSESEEEVE